MKKSTCVRTCRIKKKAIDASKSSFHITYSSVMFVLTYRRHTAFWNSCRKVQHSLVFSDLIMWNTSQELHLKNNPSLMRHKQIIDAVSWSYLYTLPPPPPLYSSCDHFTCSNTFGCGSRLHCTCCSGLKPVSSMLQLLCSSSSSIISPTKSSLRDWIIWMAPSHRSSLDRHEFWRKEMVLMSTTRQ